MALWTSLIFVWTFAKLLGKFTLDLVIDIEEHLILLKLVVLQLTNGVYKSQ